MVSANIIKKLVVTEKGTKKVNEEKQKGYVFQTDKKATKNEIKQTIEDSFGVKIEKINTLIAKGKTTNRRGYKGKKSSYKKAYIKLQPGQSINIEESL